MVNIFKLIFTTVFFLILSCAEKEVVHPVPDENRFSKERLGESLNEPMEISVAPDGRVFIVERKGALKLFDPAENKISIIHTFDVFSGLEDGLLGITLDPKFSTNAYIYVFYSPAGERSIQRVSRFTIAGNKVDTSSEKIIIEIPTQRDECCHSAGSLAFGADNNLYIAVGDNTNPHNPGYYNSTDERKGREYWDAQRTAANTNDLRGKVLRIHIEPDGTYTIPKGNLFEDENDQTRPEIFAMGCRNPYRISVDAKRNWLYWGDVGQNTIDHPERGPISYDEWHVATKSGFFGWPYFAGPNAPYAAFNWETEKIGPFFDAAKPVNASVNNTGARDLPPATGALIWYSYDESKEFKHLGTGGKSPIAGPVYYADLYASAEDENSIALPPYYNGKLFIAEWMRAWINVVTLTDDGHVEKIEPFMKDFSFKHPIDLEIGPEGALYVLEYGTYWFSDNKDAGLYRIQYNKGNRPPVVKVTADKLAGATPLSVKFSSEGTVDLDAGSVLRYEWFFDKEEVQSTAANPMYTFTKKGLYDVKVKVTDEKGKQSMANLSIKVGNEVPEVQLRVQGNASFYWDNTPVHYAVSVSDQEDGNLGDGGINKDDVDVLLSYSTMGTDIAMVEQSEESIKTSSPGWEIIKNNDCKACHGMKEKSVGPSYFQIASRYPKNKENIEKLAQKIIKGGSGAWGENVMSAHPQLTLKESKEIVSFILTLNNDATQTQRLPLNGSFVPDRHLKDRSNGEYILTINYKDKAIDEISSNTVQKRFIFQNATVPAISCDDNKGVAKPNYTVAFTENNAFILFKDIDLKALKSVTLSTSSYQVDGVISFNIDSVKGEQIGKVYIEKDSRISTQKHGEEQLPWKEHNVKLKEQSGRHSVYIVFQQDKDAKVKADQWNSFYLKWLRFN